jgi:hypothetical protein
MDSRKYEENQNNLKVCFEKGFSVMKSNIKARIQGLGSALMELNKNIKGKWNTTEERLMMIQGT